MVRSAEECREDLSTSSMILRLERDVYRTKEEKERDRKRGELAKI